MAFDPQLDPTIPPDPFGGQAEPWAWVPSSWNTPSAADLNQALAPQIDPAVVPMPAPDPLAVPALPPIGPTPDPTQPGLGIPASALDAALPAAPPPPAPEPSIELPFAQPPPIQELPSVRDRPPVPDVDATTGAAPLPEAAQQRLSSEQAFQRAVADNIGDPLAIPDDAQRQRAVNELAMRDPAGFAELQLKHAAAREKEIGAKRLEIANKDYEQQQANLLARQEADKASRAKAEELLADAQRIAATKEDPTGGLSGGQRIAGVLGAIIGGLVQGRTGAARNAGLDALNEQINRGIAAQRANMANRREGIALRRSALADEFARHGDDYRSAEAVRLAALKHADDLLATEQLNYDPKGSTALKIAGLRAGIAAQQQQAIQAYQQKNFENSLKLQDAARQQQIADQTALHQRQQLGLGYAQIKSAAEDRKLAREQRLEDKALERADREAERARQFTLSSPRPMVAVDDKGKPVVDANGKPVTAPQRFVNADGKPWELGSPERTAAMEAKLNTASELSDILYEVKDIRENLGKGVVPWSAARQRLTVLEERATTIAKQGTQGMSSDNDFRTLRRSVGADDFKSFMDISATLDEAQTRNVSALNTAMRTANYTGPAVTFANKYGEKAQETVDEIRLEKLLTDPGRDETELRKVAAAQERARTDNSEEAWSAYRSATASAFEATPYQRDAITQLGVAALGPADDPDATKARQKLAKVAEEGPTSTLRRLAKSALESTALRDANSGATQPDRAVSFETLPPGGR